MHYISIGSNGKRFGGFDGPDVVLNPPAAWRMMCLLRNSSWLFQIEDKRQGAERLFSVQNARSG